MRKKNFNVNFVVNNMLPFKNCMFNKLLHIGSAQEYTYDTQVIMKYCYISMQEVENGELIQKKKKQTKNKKQKKKKI